MLGLILLVIPFFSKHSKALVVVGFLLSLLGLDAWGFVPLDRMWAEIGDVLDGLV